MSDLLKYKGHDVALQIDVDEQRFNYVFPIIDVFSPYNFLYIAIFVVPNQEDSFMKALTQAKRVRILIKGPEAVKEAFDVQQEEFYLEGLMEYREKAHSLCEHLKLEDLYRSETARRHR